MNEYDVKRLALVFAIQAEIEGMKTYNRSYPETVGHSENEFYNKAEELRVLASKHNEQL